MSFKIKKIRSLIFLSSTLILFFLPSRTLQAQNARLEFLRDFIQGTFRIIGQYPDSSALYAGTMRLYEKDSMLYFDRQIAGERYQGKAQLQTSGTDSVPVLRIQWRQNNKKWECTYLIQSDLDNYPRLTGYVYLKEGLTKRPGIEAAFPSHSE